MRISRREFLKYCTIAAGALGLTTTDLLKIEESFAKIGNGGPHVVWLPGQACTGCKVSLANTVFYTDVASLLLTDIDLDYSETLMAASGAKAVDSAISAIGKTTVLMLEGAIPSAETGGDEEFCTVWSRTSGIVAAGSTINGTTINSGILTSKIATGRMLQQGDVIKVGSEITTVTGVATTTFPAGTIISSAADRTAIGGTYAGAGTSGSNVLNTNVVLTVGQATALNPVSGDIVIWGGTSAPLNTIASTSVLTAGTIVNSSFDRLWLQNLDSGFPAATNWNATTNSWSLQTNGDWQLAGPDVTLNLARAVAGPTTIVALCSLAAGTVLKAGTSVADPNDRLAIDPSLAIFGYGTTDADTLSAARTFPAASGDYVLTGDITIPVATGIGTGSLGYGTTEKDKTMLNESRLFATSAAAVLCVGTCSSFGGIPAATGNKTGAAGALYKGLTKPTVHNGALTEFAAKTINIPGCPPHSDWIVGTVAYLLARSLQALPPLEAYGRPIDYFGMYQCNAGPCEWRYNQGYKFADETDQYACPKGPLTANPANTSYGIPANTTINSSKLYKFKWNSIVSTGTDNGKRPVGCIGVLGCKGRKTKADCSLRRWNADAAGKYGSGWCVSSGAGCHGCTEPTFPDKVGKFFNFA